MFEDFDEHLNLFIWQGINFFKIYFHNVMTAPTQKTYLETGSKENAKLQCETYHAKTSLILFLVSDIILVFMY